ncbi:hypothetical protein IW262DRAFT_532480 [Armillaria fumosa]|nr:hypothetical protein IW262DRAFT_532480 [Armillaria fumosa]
MMPYPVSAYKITKLFLSCLFTSLLFSVTPENLSTYLFSILYIALYTEHRKLTDEVRNGKPSIVASSKRQQFSTCVLTGRMSNVR